VLPAPAEPLGDELELDGELLDEAPPLALSFFASSDVEDDEELAPGVELLEGELVVPEAELEDGELGAGAAVVPEAELEDEPGVLVEPEPEGVVALEEEAPAGAFEPVSALLQPAIIAPPNARETARARVENFMGPPWLGYGKEAARIGPGMLRSHPATDDFAHFVVGAASGLFGPAWSPLCWKSRCCADDFGSTCPCCGFAPSRFSDVVGVPALAELVVEPAAEEGSGDVLSVLGDGVGVALRSQPAAKASDRAATRVRSLICAPR
jgi:hypothetical protein